MAIYKKHNKGISCCLEDKDIYKISQDQDNSSLYEVSRSSDYACVYLLDKKSKCAFIYGCHGNFCPSFQKDLIKSDVHKTAHKKAFSGEKVTYEWFFGDYQTTYYQSTVIPLKDENGITQSILGLVMLLDEKLALNNKDFAVAEGADRGFVRLMLNAREEEKRLISSALHDEIGSAAVMINSLLSILKEDILDGKQNDALKNVQNVQEAVEGSISRIKRVIVNLRPPQIAEVGLNSAVKEFLDNLEQSVNLKFNYSYNVAEDTNISENVKITLYRIVQEATNNTLKHAKADTMKIVFDEDDSNILLNIKDDGIGYPKTGHKGINKMGILGMKESISHLGGTIKIEGVKGEGTTISVICPKISYARKL